MSGKKIVDKVSGIFIPVTNMKRSIEWYQQMFELEIIQESEICTGLAFPGEATMVGLWKVDRPQPTQFEGGGGGYFIPYFNFESFDIEYSHALLKKNGVDVSDIKDEGDIKHFDCKDPDGNHISIVEELPSSHGYYEHKQKYRKK